MLVDIRRCNVIAPDGTEFTRVRFIFKAGTAAIWREDEDARTADRLAWFTNAHFTKRRVRRDPHLLTIGQDDTETVYRIIPIGSGGCGCSSPLKGRSYEQLLAPEVSA